MSYHRRQPADVADIVVVEYQKLQCVLAPNLVSSLTARVRRRNVVNSATSFHYLSVCFHFVH